MAGVRPTSWLEERIDEILRLAREPEYDDEGNGYTRGRDFHMAEDFVGRRTPIDLDPDGFRAVVCSTWDGGATLSVPEWDGVDAEEILEKATKESVLKGDRSMEYIAVAALGWICLREAKKVYKEHTGNSMEVLAPGNVFTCTPWRL